ncbi:hypothetical protein [Gracilibacillus sp. YIM 98692]|uniref:hypothetical protein n=1 Tax=Gracilibacillus sp. YIM 98692 TaxID=2663532 RepID=UPI0013D2B91D|nr:hypothetical protein [Gracilibacillus sp. YIM 98692]
MATNERLYQGQPGTTEETLYTVGTNNTHSKVHKFQVTVANVTNTDATFDLSIVPNGGSAGDTNRIAKGVEVAGNSVANLTFNQVLEASDFLSGLQGTSGALTVTISGVIE